MTGLSYLEKKSIRNKKSAKTKKEKFISEEVQMKKILFLDLDGTLTNDEKKITTQTKEALMKIQEQGHIVALASGRPTPGMVPIARELQLEKYGGYIMPFNGGEIINCQTRETIFENVVDKKYLPELIRYARQNNLGLITYDAKHALVATRMDKYIALEAMFINKIPAYMTDVEKYVNYNPNKCLFTAEPTLSEHHERIIAEKFGNQLGIYRSSDYFIEVVPKGIDKAAAIQVLIDKLGISRENTIACGDGFNDLTMIQYAGVGVAMENAVDIVKAEADYITTSNNSDGIAHVIERYIL